MLKNITFENLWLLGTEQNCAYYEQLLTALESL